MLQNWAALVLKSMRQVDWGVAGWCLAKSEKGFCLKLIFCSGHAYCHILKERHPDI